MRNFLINYLLKIVLFLPLAAINKLDIENNGINQITLKHIFKHNTLLTNYVFFNKQYHE